MANQLVGVDTTAANARKMTSIKKGALTSEGVFDKGPPGCQHAISWQVRISRRQLKSNVQERDLTLTDTTLTARIDHMF